MGEINVRRDEQDALGAVDTEELDKLIEQCLHEERPHALLTLQLDSCGMYVASRLRNYERALAEHGKAKAAKKRAETVYRARRAGSDLAHAVREMKSRVEAEKREGERSPWALSAPSNTERVLDLRHKTSPNFIRIPSTPLLSGCTPRSPNTFAW